MYYHCKCLHNGGKAANSGRVNLLASRQTRESGPLATSNYNKTLRVNKTLSFRCCCGVFLNDVVANHKLDVHQRRAQRDELIGQIEITKHHVCQRSYIQKQQKIHLITH